MSPTAHTDPFALLLADGIVDEVLGRLKSGKEADVWLVRYRGEIVAAKIYKERLHRSFKHNADYKEGRAVRDSRTRRAMERGSRFGQTAQEEAWKSAEADALFRLHAEGVRVPTPHVFYEGVLLMELVVDASGQPAPRLIDVALDAPRAAALYAELRTEVVKMLLADAIHGDLSPYNVLLGANGPVIIDFPQLVSAAHNSRAEFFFRRDLDNLRHFLGGFDRSLLARGGDVPEIWRAFVRRELSPAFEPSGKPQQAPPPRRHEPQRGQQQHHPRGQPQHPQQHHGHGRGEQRPPGGNPRHGQHGRGQHAPHGAARAAGTHGPVVIHVGQPGSAPRAAGHPQHTGHQAAQHGAHPGQHAAHPPGTQPPGGTPGAPGQGRRRRRRRRRH